MRFRSLHCVRRVRPVAAVLALLAPSCSDVTGPPRGWIRPPEDVIVFVRGESLPDVRAVRRLLELPGGDGLAFTVDYGRPNDCLAGCFYSRGYGLRYGGRIGWMHVYDYDGIDVPALRHFDVAATDAGLFADATWSYAAEHDSWFLWSVLLPMLSADPDTPGEAAHRMAALLEGFIAPWLAEDLLERALAENDTALLQKLACLPVFSGDAYASVRERARAALGNAFVPCTAEPRA